jgi:lysozyme
VISRLSPAARKGSAGLVLASAALMAFITGREGTRYDVYLDIVGVPTVCQGHTGPDVVIGERWTPQECAAVETNDIKTAGTAVLACITTPLNQNEYDAFTSLAYNIGAHKFCGSTLVKTANAGDLPGACAQILRWNQAGGRVVQGLDNRRRAEYAMCTRPVAAPAANAPTFKAAA